MKKSRDINGNDTERQSTLPSLFLQQETQRREAGALIEATEWRAQSNWISSAVSSNLIWPALWRMTGERNTFSCLLPTTPDPPPHPPLGVPPAQSDQQTCSFHQTTGQHLLCGLPPLPAPLLLTPRPQATPLLPPPPPHPDVPQTTLAFSCLSHTSATFSWVLQTLKGHGGGWEEEEQGDGDVQTIPEDFPKWNALLLKEPYRDVLYQDCIYKRWTQWRCNGLCGVKANHRVSFIKI